MPEDKIMGAAISFEVGQMQGLRNLVATPIEMGQQCPCTPRGEGKGWLGDELLTFTLPQAGSLQANSKAIVSRDANSSGQSQGGFSSGDLSVICSLSKQSPECVHDFILRCCLGHLPTYLHTYLLTSSYKVNALILL